MRGKPIETDDGYFWLTPPTISFDLFEGDGLPHGMSATAFVSASHLP